MITFKDHPEFKPNLSPHQILKMGAFGGTYFRPIYSSVTKKHYKSEDVIKEYPKSWFKGIDIEKMVTSSKYDKKVNKYGVKCGSELEDWEKSGWIMNKTHMVGFNGIVDFIWADEQMTIRDKLKDG